MPLKGKRDYIIPHGVANITWLSLKVLLNFNKVSKVCLSLKVLLNFNKVNKSIQQLIPKLHPVQVNLLALATEELAHKLNCKAEPQPRELKANLGSHSLG